MIEQIWGFGVLGFWGFGDLTRAVAQSSALGGAGYFDFPVERMAINMDGVVREPRDIANTVIVARGGKKVSVGQVADVQFGQEAPVGDCLINGEPGVGSSSANNPTPAPWRFPAGSIARWRVLKMGFPEDVTMYPDLFRQAEFIHESVGNLKKALILGCLLVVLVLIVFLFEWRAAMISVIAVPLSLLGAVLTIRLFGGTLNAMTLGGLAIAIGEVVDDAIIDVENIFRRLILNRQSSHPAPVMEVVLNASLEVRSAVVYASFIVSLVFLPVFFLRGVSGAIFSPIGYTYILAIMVSLGVAVTVTPVLCLYLLPSITNRPAKPPWVFGLIRWYRRCVEKVLEHWKLAMAFSILLMALAIILLPFLGGGFLPDFREPNFVIHMSGEPGTSLEESARVGGRIARELLKVPGVKSVVQQAGRAEESEDIGGTNYSELWLAIDPGAVPYAKIYEGVNRIASDVPGFTCSVKQFLKERLDEVLTGTAAPVVIKVYGNNLPTLRAWAWFIREAISRVPGAVEATIYLGFREPQLNVFVRREDALKWGLAPGQILDAVRTAVTGKIVGEIHDGSQIINIVVKAPRSGPARSEIVAWTSDWRALERFYSSKQGGGREFYRGPRQDQP